MDVLPVLERQHDVLSLRTAVKNLHIVKLGSVFNANGGMFSIKFLTSSMAAESPLLYHHQCFTVEVLYGKPLFLRKRMFSCHRTADAVGAELFEIAQLKPIGRVTGPYQKIIFFAQRCNFRQYTCMESSKGTMCSLYPGKA